MQSFVVGTSKEHFMTWETFETARLINISKLQIVKFNLE